MNYLVYKHTSPSGKSYIGLTSNYEERCRCHQKPNSQCIAFASAIKKYGWDNFTHEILYDNLDEEAAVFREQQSILEYGTMVPYGYNLTAGGESGRLSESTKQKIAEGRKGHRHTAETKQRIGDINRGRVLSVDARRKMSETRRGQKRGPFTHEHKQALSKTWTLVDPSGSVITITNLHEYCKLHKLTPGCMSKLARGKIEQYRGWTRHQVD